MYNCAAYIGAALDSILPQSDDSIEVVVYDGGSNDGTESVLADYLARWSNLRYHRAARKGGIDADMAACVALATGDYCWLFSGDDVMRAHAVERLTFHLRDALDLYLCEHTICDRQMRVLRPYPVLRPDLPLSGDLRNEAFRHEWFQRAVSTEAFFSFMSGLIVRRSLWQSGRLSPEFDGSCWAHVVRLFELARSGLRVRYVAETWLDQRGGNDSFLNNGLVKRYALAIEGYDRIAESLFGRSSVEAHHMRRVIRFEFTPRMFLLGRLLCHENPAIESRARLDELFDRIYGGAGLANLLIRLMYRATPIAAIKAARKVWVLTHRNSSLRSPP